MGVLRELKEVVLTPASRIQPTFDLP